MRTGPALILAATLLLFVLVGILTRVRNLEEYWVAGRRIGPVSSGMAIASNWMSAASFLGMAGLLYLQGYFGLAYVLGWCGGYVLLLVLMAAQIRNYGKFTAPDFIGDRYYSTTARFLAAIITLVISFVYAVGQYKGIGEMFKWIFGMDYKLSIITGTIVVLSYVLLSGMMGVVRNQQVQYIVLITAFLLPLFFIAKKLGFFYFVPQVGYGEAVAQLQETQPQFVLPWGDVGIYQWIALCFTLMVGTAGLPHVIQRFYLVPQRQRRPQVGGLGTLLHRRPLLELARILRFRQDPESGRGQGSGRRHHHQRRRERGAPGVVHRPPGGGSRIRRLQHRGGAVDGRLGRLRPRPLFRALQADRLQQGARHRCAPGRGDPGFRHHGGCPGTARPHRTDRGHGLRHRRVHHFPSVRPGHLVEPHHPGGWDCRHAGGGADLHRRPLLGRHGVGFLDSCYFVGP